MKKQAASIIVFILMCMLLNLMGCSKKTETYYPVKEGQTWQYQVSLGSMLGSEGGGKLVITNLALRELKGKKVTPQKVELAGQTHFVFIAEDDNGIYEFAEQSPGSVEPQIKDSPAYLMKYPIKANNTWEEKTKTSLLKQNLSITLKSTIESTDETVTVPAGTFKSCLKVKGTGAAKKDLGILGVANVSVEHHNWYAPGVGMVKTVLKENSNNMMVGSGELTLQLESFKK